MTARLIDRSPWGWFRRLLVGSPGAVVDVTALLSALAAGGYPKVVKVALGTTTSAGGVFAWANPEVGSIVVNRVTLNVTTQSTGAGTVSVGQAANGTTSAANLIDTLSVHTAGVFDNIQNPGSGGKPLQVVAAGAFVTASQASGAVAGLVGAAYIEYFVI